MQNNTVSKGTIWGSIALQTIILLAAIVGVWAGIEKRLITHDLAIAEIRSRFDHDEKDERNLDLSRMNLHHNISSCFSVITNTCHHRGNGFAIRPEKKEGK